jgi:YesN/AraC family two-component response regulator
MSQDTAHILVIDDEEGVRDYYRHLLSKAGYDVQTVAGGEEAVRLLEGQTVDLILLDLRMPKMNGAGFLRQLRHQKHRPDVLVVSGYATLEDAVEVTKLGACGVIEKLALPERMLAAIGRLLDLRRDPLISYVRANFDKVVSREAVASRFQVSPETVSNRIKTYTSQSFHDFLESCRIQEAQRLLATTELEAKEVAGRVGFRSHQVFDRAFRRLQGYTPSQYRKEVRPQC